MAKEYVAAQDPEDPGVLVLSRFAGAANELTSALIVNPYDRDEVAAALDKALTMSRTERISRYNDMMEILRKTTLVTGGKASCAICARLRRAPSRMRRTITWRTFPGSPD